MELEVILIAQSDNKPYACREMFCVCSRARVFAWGGDGCVCVRVCLVLYVYPSMGIVIESHMGAKCGISLNLHYTSKDVQNASSGSVKKIVSAGGMIKDLI